MNSVATLRQYILQQPLHRAIQFRLSVTAQMARDDWQQTFKSQFRQEKQWNLDPLAWLKTPLAALDPLFHGSWLLVLAGSFLGAATMSVALAYRGNAPVNLWLLLGLFAILPLLLSLVAAVSVLGNANSSNLAAKCFRLLHHRLLKENSLLSNLPVVTGWAKWQLMYFSVAFQISAMVTFILVALVWNLTFAWSSTLITDPVTMQQLFNGFGALWMVLLPDLTIEAVKASRYPLTQPISNSEIAWFWWQYAMFAMLCFGLLPRLILLVGCRWRLKYLLERDLKEASDLARLDVFWQGLKNNANPAVEDEVAVSALDWKLPEKQNQTVIGWQIPGDSKVNVQASLGFADWQSDIAWLNQNAAGFSRDIFIAVSLQQTPLAELADIIEHIRGLQPNLRVRIWLLKPAVKMDVESALQSWALFAEQHQIPLANRKNE